MMLDFYAKDGDWKVGFDVIRSFSFFGPDLDDFWMRKTFNRHFRV